MGLSLVSVNVEGSKHLERVLPFLEKHKPDVACIQELSEPDIPHFEKVIGPLVAFVRMNFRLDHGSVYEGLAIFSRHAAENKNINYYRGPRELPPYDMRSAESKYATENAMLLYADITSDATYRIATTHFTWTPDGQPSDLQRIDLRKLLPLLDAAGEFVLCGDFNAPRGGEIFGELASRFTDNIPSKYETSLDISLHRAGKAKPHELVDKMVDGLFTTAAYRAESVDLVFGVSDHAAITATITRT